MHRPDAQLDRDRHPGPAQAAHAARRAAQRRRPRDLGRGRRDRLLRAGRPAASGRATGSSPTSCGRSPGGTPVLGVVTKTDLAGPSRSPSSCIAARRRSDASSAEVVPCSAVDGFQVDLLADLLVARLPEGPPLYPDGELTDEPEETLVAELIREAALEGVRDELPHSIAVVVEEMMPARGPPDDAAARRARDHLRRAVQPEGHRDRQGRRAAAGRRHRGPRGRSRRCWARRSTSTCTSRSPRTGSATRSSCASWASRPTSAARGRGSKGPGTRSLRHLRRRGRAKEHGVNVRGHHTESRPRKEGHEPSRRHCPGPARHS